MPFFCFVSLSLSVETREKKPSGNIFVCDTQKFCIHFPVFRWWNFLFFLKLPPRPPISLNYSWKHVVWLCFSLFLFLSLSFSRSGFPKHSSENSPCHTVLAYHYCCCCCYHYYYYHYRRGKKTNENNDALYSTFLPNTICCRVANQIWITMLGYDDKNFQKKITSKRIYKCIYRARNVNEKLHMHNTIVTTFSVYRGWCNEALFMISFQAKICTRSISKRIEGVLQPRAKTHTFTYFVIEFLFFFSCFFLEKNLFLQSHSTLSVHDDDATAMIWKIQIASRVFFSSLVKRVKFQW